MTTRFRRAVVASALLLLLGAGCAPRVAAPPVDDTPESNPENCAASGGSILDGVCVCPEGYMADPADFCLDAQGVPGGTMKP
ncbi:MAG TPA: hypothetical protein VJ694_02330 [Patescibacteria group bacterium]|nr:hypothetical protein [Patescibacteria group bacterium]